MSMLPPQSDPRVDWGDALAPSTFYGRKEELAQLTHWLVQEHCRVVSLLGMGGIGKSALAVSLMYQLSGHFEVVIFRSLRDAPSCEVLLDDCLQVLVPQSPRQATLERRIRLLLEHLRETHVLLILDNLEALLKEGDVRGHFRSGFESYGLLLNCLAEASHQSCLLLTSREKPAELRHLENRYSQVRSLRLAGLDRSACQQLFIEKEVVGTSAEQEQLIEIYGGNPLALKIVGETIANLFSSKIGEFLSKSKVIFGNITDLLGEHFARLSPLEQSILCWLAIARELMTLDELLAVLIKPLPRMQVLDAVDSLRRRSLIEPGKRPTGFTLQSVVLEYVMVHLVAEACREIQHHRLDKLIQYGFSQARAKEYVRQTQERLLISPLFAALQSAFQTRADVEAQLLSLLDELRKRAAPAQGYGPANLITLLRMQRGHLSGLDLSHLSIREMYLQGVEMHDTSLVETRISGIVLTEAITAPWAVAISSDGKWWAAGSMQGKVRVWEEENQTLHLIWQAHCNIVNALVFSPDGRTLASGSPDGTVKLWNIAGTRRDSGLPLSGPRGALLWTGWQTFPQCLAFSPDGSLLASANTFTQNPAEENAPQDERPEEPPGHTTSPSRESAIQEEDHSYG